MGSVTVSLLISPNESKTHQPKLLVKLKLFLFLCTAKPEWWLSFPKENSPEHRGCDFFIAQNHKSWEFPKAGEFLKAIQKQIVV